MNHLQIQNWIATICQQVRNKQPLEDSRVELKSVWPSKHEDAARQISALANAALGLPVLWIIGIHERDGIKGCVPNELSSWWDQVRSYFDGSIPELMDVNYGDSESGKCLKGLYFGTQGAPYVIKTKEKSQIEYTVWWREGTSTRRARRSDLIRILSPLQSLPEVEILRSEVSCWDRHRIDGREGLKWDFEIDLYITPLNQTRVVIPFHRSSIAVKAPSWHNQIPNPKCILRTHLVEPEAIVGFKQTDNKCTSTEAIIDAPGMWKIRESIETNHSGAPLDHDISVSLRLQPANCAFAVSIEKVMKYARSEKGEYGLWRSL